MPPKAKFTREQIVAAAIGITEREGFEALTARALGEELGSSARPIFTVFRNMEEVQCSVIAAAKKAYAAYVAEGLAESSAFKGVGEAYIRFAADRPKLFRLLFMREQDTVPDMSEVLGIIEGDYDKILKSIEEGYGVGGDIAIKLYQHLWIYSHGIAVLIATKVCKFTDTEISTMLTEVFSGLIAKIKAEGNR